MATSRCPAGVACRGPGEETPAVFDRHAEAAGVAVPRLCGVRCESGSGWSWRGRVLAGPADWARFLMQSEAGGERPTGNLIAPVCLGDGRIAALIGADRHGVMRQVAPAPRDGPPELGARPPAWGDADALVRRAAPVFLPMRWPEPPIRGRRRARSGRAPA